MVEQMSVYGRALRAYAAGDRSATLTLEREDGGQVSVPVAVFFRTTAAFLPLEWEALYACRGRVLDVGAGTGVHTRWLQERGMTVTAIDVAAEAVAIMCAAGVQDARYMDIWAVAHETFDTILLLGRSIGLAGDLAGLAQLLAHFRALATPGGQVLLTSLDIRRAADPHLCASAAASVAAGRYPGETRFTERFGALCGPVIRWLYVDPEALTTSAAPCGWLTEVLSLQPDGNYLARLSPAATCPAADN